MAKVILGAVGECAPLNFEAAVATVSQLARDEEMGGILTKLERQMGQVSSGFGIDGIALLTMRSEPTGLLQTAVSLSALIRHGRTTRFTYMAESALEQNAFSALRKILEKANPGLKVEISDDVLTASMPERDNSAEPGEKHSQQMEASVVEGSAFGFD